MAILVRNGGRTVNDIELNLVTIAYMANRMGAAHIRGNKQILRRILGVQERQQLSLSRRNGMSVLEGIDCELYLTPTEATQFVRIGMNERLLAELETKAQGALTQLTAVPLVDISTASRSGLFGDELLMLMLIVARNNCLVELPVKTGQTAYWVMQHLVDLKKAGLIKLKKQMQQQERK